MIDSHSEGVDDRNGCADSFLGSISPFREKSWYYRETDHALRLL